MSWKTASLGELADVQLGKMLDQKKNQGEYRRYLGNDNVQWNQFRLDEVKEMRIKDSERERYGLRPGDLLICEGGDPGRCALWTSDEEMYYQKALNRVRVYDGIDPCYLLYYFLHIGATREVAQYYTGGATIKHLPNAALKRVEVRYPDLEMQRHIASILMVYDNLIENNRRQIALLEEAAQRLYREWFVELRFPGREDAEIVDGIPKGWRIASIEETCKKIQSGGTPSRKKAAYWNPGTVKWFKTGELQDCWLISPEEHISEDGLNGSAAKLFPPQTIVMAIYASPTLGRLGILNYEAAFNQAMLGFVIDESLVTREWLYWKLHELRLEFNLIARGTGQQNISGEIVKTYEILLPPRDLIEQFTDAVAATTERRLKLQEQIIATAEARDRLLLKLMSGEIEV